MSPVTHFLAGWTLGTFCDDRRSRAAITLAGVAPDLDGLGIIPEILTRNSDHPLPWFSEYHHVLGHNIWFAVVVTIAAYLYSRRSWKAAALSFVSFHLHLLCDLIGARGPDGHQWPIEYLSPLSHALQWTWSGQWMLNAWQNFVITFVLLAVMFYFAVTRCISPLEIVSTRANVGFVAALRRRFGSARSA